MEHQENTWENDFNPKMASTPRNSPKDETTIANRAAVGGFDESATTSDDTPNSNDLTVNELEENGLRVPPPTAKTSRTSSKDPTVAVDDNQAVADGSTRHLGHIIFDIFREICDASWMFLSMFITFYGPVIYEEERQRDHQIEITKNGEKLSADSFKESDATS